MTFSSPSYHGNPQPHHLPESRRWQPAQGTRTPGRLPCPPPPPARVPRPPSPPLGVTGPREQGQEVWSPGLCPLRGSQGPECPGRGRGPSGLWDHQGQEGPEPRLRMEMAAGGGVLLPPPRAGEPSGTLGDYTRGGGGCRVLWGDSIPLGVGAEQLLGARAPTSQAQRSPQLLPPITTCLGALGCSGALLRGVLVPGPRVSPPVIPRGRSPWPGPWGQVPNGHLVFSGFGVQFLVPSGHGAVAVCGSASGGSWGRGGVARAASLGLLAVPPPEGGPRVPWGAWGSVWPPARLRR